jgi:signal transduction histidine kinase
MLSLRLGLRWKILTLTALPLLALAGATLWLVDRGVSERSEEALTDDLRRAAGVFENMLAASATELVVTGAVVVRDPRFFSVLALPHGRNDPEYRATVAGVAQDFHQLAQPDVFEIVDQRGELVTSVGRIRVQPAARELFVGSVLAGRGERRAIAQKGSHVLLVGTPVVADGRVVGALLLGREVSGGLAARLRELTSSQVSFVYEHHITRTTLGVGDERDVARRVARASSSQLDRPVRDGGWIAYARPLPMAAEGTRQVYVLQRSLGAETAFLRSVRGHLLELGLLLLAAVVLATAFIASHITSPIRQLVTAASAMEEGDFEAPIDRGRRDEMGYLATRFDDMRKRQRTYVRSLQEVARAKSEFIAVASHELRTPISIIRGWEDLLRSGMIRPGDDKYSSCLDAISRACTTLEKIAISATRMAQATDSDALPAPTTTEVEPMLGEALREAAGAAPDRRVSLSLDVHPDVQFVIVDRAQVTQAVDALVRNGIRFTPDGGSVVVRASADAEEFVIEVRDSGIGLSAEARRRLFDESFVKHDSRHHHTAQGLEFNVAGMGFGLALVRRVVESHGGRLLVDGEEGRGSVFTLRFPGALLAHEDHRRAA